MAEECVIDTTVLQRANIALTSRTVERRRFKRRLVLLNTLREGRKILLLSEQLAVEYHRQIKRPMNDYVKTFFELLVDPQRCVLNWTNWPAARREKARKCRYPREDDHVLRTAIRPHATTIFAEENRMIRADECIHRHFKVHIREP